MSNPTTATAPRPNPVQTRPEVHALLDRLHALSLQQESTLHISSTAAGDTSFDDRVRDKLVALDQDKCQFVYQLVRAKGARTVLEVGTSFGVSTIYLALAVLANQSLAAGGSSAGTGAGSKGEKEEKEEKKEEDEGKSEYRVIATEYEPTKATSARAYWAEVGDGVPGVIDLREGDLRETLPGNLPALDMVLLDIWAPMALPALRIAEPHLRPGAVIICDNSIGSAHRYRDLQAYMREEGSGYTNMTLPFSNGLEMSVWTGTGTKAGR